MVLSVAGCAAPGGSPGAAAAAAPTPAAAPERTYRVYVGAESADLLHRVRFGPGGATVERSISVGESTVEMEGPHGLQI